MGNLSSIEVPLSIRDLDLRSPSVLAGERQMAAIERLWNWPEPPKIGVSIERMSATMVDKSVTFKLKLDTSEYERSMRRMERGVRRAVREQRELRRENRRARRRERIHRLRYWRWRHRDEILMYGVVGGITILAVIALAYLIGTIGQ